MRKHDHIVEPLFGALRHPHGVDAQPGAPARSRRQRALVGLLVGLVALLALLVWFN